jgi:hypothetical protein
VLADGTIEEIEQQIDASALPAEARTLTLRSTSTALATSWSATWPAEGIGEEKRATPVPRSNLAVSYAGCDRADFVGGRHAPMVARGAGAKRGVGSLWGSGLV